jgi:hypothetical protein
MQRSVKKERRQHSGADGEKQRDFPHARTDGGDLHDRARRQKLCEDCDPGAGHGNAGKETRAEFGDDALGDQLIHGEGKRRTQNKGGAHRDLRAWFLDFLKEDNREADVAEADRGHGLQPHRESKK